MNPLEKSGFFTCIISLFFVLYRVKKAVNTVEKNQFTPAVILER